MIVVFDFEKPMLTTESASSARSLTRMTLPFSSDAPPFTVCQSSSREGSKITPSWISPALLSRGFRRSAMLMQGLCCVRDVEGGLRWLRRAALQDEPRPEAGEVGRLGDVQEDVRAEVLVDAALRAQPQAVVLAHRRERHREHELLADQGLVERLELPDGRHAYIPCERSHHHHLVCLECGRSADVGDCGIETVTTEAARRSGFLITEHRLELFGRCPSCQSRRRRTR